MILLTYVGRVQDGLILTATMDDDEQVRRSTTEYQTQAKMLLKKLDFESPPRSSIDTGPYIWHYLIEKNVCYLVLCEKTFSKRLAFSFLEDIQNQFSSHYGSQMERYTRPYHCIEFDTCIQKTKKTYVDSRARRNLNTINTELQDVQRIMVQNIDDVLQRGSALSELDSKASNLSILSQKYKKDARYLNLTSTYAKVAAAAVIVFCFTLYFWIL